LSSSASANEAGTCRWSGGERQRVAIARALVAGHGLLLADEPTGSLDSVAGAQILQLLGALRHQHGMSVLLVSYQPDAVGYADRVLHLRDGRIVEDGPTLVVSPGLGRAQPRYPPGR